MQFGKKTTHESYFDGRIKSTKVEYSIPVLVSDKSQVLNEIIKGLELITTKQTKDLVIKVEADPKTHSFKLVTRQYTVEEKS